MSYVVEHASRDDLMPAFGLMYQEESDSVRAGMIRESLKLVQNGDLNLHNILLIRQGSEVAGMLVWWSNRGGFGQFWPPRARTGPEREAMEDSLLDAAQTILRQEHVKVVQSLVPREEMPLAPALVRNGFAQVSNLFLMARDCRSAAGAVTEPGADWRFFPFMEPDRERFCQTMKRTYEGSLDFPELCDRREMTEILEGHKCQGRFDPRFWVLGHWQDQPVGVVLLTEISGEGEWELSYLGLVPEFRGRGLGQGLVQKALALAGDAGTQQLTLAVDRRNEPAFRLYAGAGFQLQGEKQVFLKFLN